MPILLSEAHGGANASLVTRSGMQLAAPSTGLANGPDDTPRRHARDMQAAHQGKGIIMKFENLPLKGLLAAGAVLLSLGAAVPTAVAADPDFTFDLPMGLACPSFDLRLEGFVADSRVSRTFYDKSGNVVRMFAGGKGNVLTFTNLSNGASLTLRTGGSVEKIGLNADGSSTYTAMGHNVVIMFPTDIPPGPSTKLYIGRLDFSIDSVGIYSLLRKTGYEMDICAALE